MTLTAERLRELLNYEPATGVFTIAVMKRRSKWNVGSVVGSPNSDGYLQIWVDGTKYTAHRLAWLHSHCRWPIHEIDHANGKRADNRLSNLREATDTQQSHNRHLPNGNNRCGLLGVRRMGQQYQARIRLDRKLYHLGTFDTAETAHAAYLAAKAQMHPFADVANHANTA